MVSPWTGRAAVGLQGGCRKMQRKASAGICHGRMTEVLMAIYF
jgi:hypothetical protein